MHTIADISLHGGQQFVQGNGGEAGVILRPFHYQQFQPKQPVV
jgi:hypothetical protein